MTNLQFSAHGLERMARRNLSPSDIDFVRRYARRQHVTGSVVRFLGARDIPAEYRRTPMAKLEGTVLIESVDGVLITVYRNRQNGWRDNRKKAKGFRRGEQAAMRGMMA